MPSFWLGLAYEYLALHAIYEPELTYLGSCSFGPKGGGAAKSRRLGSTNKGIKAVPRHLYIRIPVPTHLTASIPSDRKCTVAFSRCHSPTRTSSRYASNDIYIYTKRSYQIWVPRWRDTVPVAYPLASHPFKLSPSFLSFMIPKANKHNYHHCHHRLW